MIIQQKISVDGVLYPVILSDEAEALSAALAAGRVSLGLLVEGEDRDLSGVTYLAEITRETYEELENALGGEEAGKEEAGGEEAGGEKARGGRGPEGGELPGTRKDAAARILSEAGIDERHLERVVRRSLGLPWLICRTERLLVREFTLEDGRRVPREPEDTDGERIFASPELLERYIRHQYHFFEYGLWAVVRLEDGALVGIAGVSNWQEDREIPWEGGAPDCGAAHPPLELGYHIFRPYRRRGYAREACQAILAYVQDEYGCQVGAAVKPDNTASVRLLTSLGIPYQWV